MCIVAPTPFRTLPLLTASLAANQRRSPCLADLLDDLDDHEGHREREVADDEREQEVLPVDGPLEKRADVQFLRDELRHDHRERGGDNDDEERERQHHSPVDLLQHEPLLEVWSAVCCPSIS